MHACVYRKSAIEFLVCLYELIFIGLFCLKSCVKVQLCVEKIEALKTCTKLNKQNKLENNLEQQE